MSKILEQQYEIVSIDSVSPHPQNARQGNTPAICESINENGFFGAIYVQRSSGYILAGNHAWDAAKREGLRTIPVIYIECDNAQARKILAADNALSDQGKYDKHSLAELLTEIHSESGLRGSGFDQSQYDSLITQLGNAAIEVAASIDEAKVEPIADPTAEETPSQPAPETCSACGQQIGTSHKKSRKRKA